MKKLKKFSSFIIFLFLQFCLMATLAQSKEVKKQLYVIGGGGDPEGKTTMFDDTLKSLSNFSNNSPWETKISFNGKHEVTEQIVKNDFKKATSIGSFKKSNFNKLIKEMTKKLNSGELSEGDQLMLSIDSHGAEKDEKELSHSISLAKGEVKNFSTLEGSESVSLDVLKDLIKLASSKKVKLAILDLSCFSGNLMNLSNEKVCLISGAGSKNYAYNHFSKKLFESMATGKNLEDIFLEARKNNITMDFPMISTREGRIASDIYLKLLPFLGYNYNNITTLADQYDDRLDDEFKMSVCKTENKFQDLINAVKKMSSIDDAAKYLLTSNLVAAIKSYREFQQRYESALAYNMVLEKEVDKVLNSVFPQQKEKWSTMNTLDFVQTDYAAKIAEIKKIYENSKDKKSKALEAKLIKELQNNEDISKKVLSKLDSFTATQIANSKKLLNEVSDKSYALASAVSVQARQLFDSMYKENMTKESNACREFVL